jgi:hypothetical protein
MVWRLILRLALVGVLMGILSLFGLTGKIEWLYWVVFGLFTAYAIGRIVPEKPFQHGLVTGCFWITSTLIKVIFYDTYIRFNPDFVATYANVSGGIGKARIFMLITAPLQAVMIGLLIGFVAWIISRSFAKSPDPKP